MTGTASSARPEFERFLYASVGEDRNGYVVTVLSTLARLGLDPWKEAAELAALGREAAQTRLERLLSGFRDVPELANDHGAVAQELTLLLPEHQSLRGSKLGGSVLAPGLPGSRRSTLAILVILLILAQVLFVGVLLPGE
jgi:hypothetical protein